jgi:hypothetical protein
MIFITMKIIITEEQSLFLRRRVNEIEKLVSNALNTVDPEDYNKSDYVEEICWQVIDYYTNTLKGEDINNIYDYVRNNYSDIITSHYFKQNLR